MIENEENSKTTPPEALSSTNGTSEFISAPLSPRSANQCKASPGKASKAGTAAGKTDAKKKCKIRFDMDLSENQIENIFKGTAFSKTPMPTKLGMLRTIVQQIKVSDLRDFAFKAVSAGGDRTADGGDSGSE